MDGSVTERNCPSTSVEVSEHAHALRQTPAPGSLKRVFQPACNPTKRQSSFTQSRSHELSASSGKIGQNGRQRLSTLNTLELRNGQIDRLDRGSHQRRRRCRVVEGSVVWPGCTETQRSEGRKVFREKFATARRRYCLSISSVEQ